MRRLHKPAAALLTLGLVATGSFGGDEAAVQPQQAYPPSIRYEANISAGGVAPAGGSLQNPYKGNKQIAESGAALFVSMNCDGCHGGGATGWVGPSLADGRWRYGGADDEVFESIYYGRSERHAGVRGRARIRRHLDPGDLPQVAARPGQRPDTIVGEVTGWDAAPM